METHRELSKKVADSRTEQSQIIMPGHINGMGRLFGGQMMEWIDVVAGVTARRHSNCDVTTAAVDQLLFEAPAYVNDTLILIGEVTYVGNSSMEVRVDSFVESLKGNRKMVNRAYLVMVAIGQDGKPTRVPRLELITKEEQLEWLDGQKRHKLRQQRRREQY
ncbi:MAG: acyl-CoA thioesterase [Clostridiales bacterium]|nr:acyl-CoA thioesterase [Clostridiales bacterium]